MRRRSIRSTGSADGRPRLATRASRFRRGTGGSSTLPRPRGRKTYCDEVAGIAKSHGLTITELATHLQGQLVAVNPAYDEAFDAFAPKDVRGKPAERQTWAVEQMMLAAKASKRLGLTAHPTFSGALAWPYLYPWPQRAPGLIETAFEELANRWKPILDAFDDAGCDVCYELHPGEDLFDGTTFERFLDAVIGHTRCRSTTIRRTSCCSSSTISASSTSTTRGSAFHVKDAEFNPTGRQGVYSGYSLGGAGGPLPLAWRRPGRFRRHLLENCAIRLFDVGGAGMGMLPQASGGGRTRRRRVHPRTI